MALVTFLSNDAGGKVRFDVDASGDIRRIEWEGPGFGRAIINTAGKAQISRDLTGAGGVNVPPGYRLAVSAIEVSWSSS